MAARLRAAIGLYEQLSPTELNALWDLAQSKDAVRDSFLRQALEHPATAEQFNRRADMALQAGVGIDRDRREKVLNDIVFPYLRRPPSDLSIKMACTKIGIALSTAGGGLDFSVFAVGTLLEAIERTTDIKELGALAEALKAVPGKLASAEAQKAFARLLADMEQTADIKELWALAEALKAVPGSMDRQILVDLLKWPISVGVFRSTLLEMLERQTHEKFDGNLWTMVTWAQANGLDVWTIRCVIQSYGN
jgi:hypothetical protein